ncbi:MAG TPA: OmcA/MtrC family decaheme c-type cytochrome [Candidatus Deferrimicrobiaceae bacterium]|jgi:OmcA/MtrC family decaheme c-type cytochrome
MKRHSALFLVASLAASLLLAGCWGSDRTIGATAPVAAPAATGNLNAAITSVSIPADGKPVVTFSLYDENGAALDPAVLLASSGGSLRFQIARIKADGYYENYIKNASGLPSYDVAIPSASQFAALGGGVYTYKFANAIDNASQTLGGIVLAGNEALTHTVAFTAARNVLTSTGKTFQQAVNPYLHFRPDGGAVTTSREIVAVSNCNGCHGKLAPHGGTRRDVALCVMCHYAGVRDIKGAAATGNSINLRDLVHKIHYGVNLPSNKAGGKFVIGGDSFADVKFPLNSGDPLVTNTPIKCIKCHKAGTDAAGRPFGRDASRYKANPTPAKCMSCHDTMIFDSANASVVVKGGAAGQDNVTVPDTNPNIVKHYNYAQRNLDVTGAQADNTAVCSTCHVQTALAGTEYKLGDIQGVHTLVEESSFNFTVHFQILAVDNVDAVNRSPRVTFKVAYDNGAAIAPSTVANVTNLTLKLGYIPAGAIDFSNDLMFNGGVTPTKPGEAMSLAITGSTTAVDNLVDNGNGTYTARFSSIGSVLPAAASAGVGIVTLEGRVGLPGTITTPRKTLSNANTRFSGPAAQWYFDLATGTHVTDSARMRRQVVDTNKCRNCHGILRGHSGSRYNVEECVVCHNPNLSDNVDVPTYPEYPAVLRYMIMRIHRGTLATQPYMVGPGRSSVRFPGDTRNCLLCHVDSLPLTFGVPLKAGMLPVTVSRGAIQNDSADDTKIGPIRASCVPCHDSPTFPLPHILLQTTGSASNPTELCANCHSTGLLLGPDFAHEAVK